MHSDAPEMNPEDETVEELIEDERAREQRELAELEEDY